MPHHNQASGYPEQREYGWPVGSRVWYNDDYAWQTVDSFAKLKNNAFGVKEWDALNNAVQPVKDFIGNVAQQPIVQQIVETVSPTIKKAYGAIRYSPGPIKAFADNLEGTKEVLDDKLNTAGIDTRFGDAGVALLEETVGAGVGRGLSTAVKAADYLSTANRLVPVEAGGGLRLGRKVTTNNLSPTVMEAVTINNPQVASVTGRQLGDEIIANDPKLAKHLTDRQQKIQMYDNRIETNQEALLIARQEGDKAAAKSADKAVKRTRPKKYSEESNVKPFTDDDPQLYGSSNRVQVQDAWEKKRVEKYGDIKNQVEAHHLVLKGGTASAFRKMEEFVAQGRAHMDDVVTMFEYAEKRGVAPGDRSSNNAFQLKTPHNELHQKVLKKKDKSGLAAELDQEGWNKVLREIKTPEQLMEWWVDQVDNNYVPNKATGKIWQDLDDLINDVQSLN
tara:strand:- start:1072 stop:2415 length:1344 start_codon:yes stop_codon:yes gene_type:complete